MPTTKKRINITLGAELEKLLNLLAKRDSVPKATKAVELLKKAIEEEEDEILSEIAEARWSENPILISEEEVWS